MKARDWKTVPLGEVLTLQRGYDLPARERRPGEFPVITSSGFSGTHIVPRVQGPGVVTGRYGTVGDVFYIAEDFWPHNTTLYVKDFKGNDPLFVAYLLRTVDFQYFSGKTGVPGVNRNELHKITVSLPPLPEQRAIAAALGDVDALLAALERLIAKRRAVKQAAMDVLLSGRVRLPGFGQGAGYRQTEVGVIPEDWEVRRLEEVAHIDPETLGADTPPNYEFNYISIENVDKGTLVGYSEQVFRAAPSRARIRIRPGDVLFCTVRPNLQSHLLFDKGSGDWVCSTGFCVLRAKPQVCLSTIIFFQVFSSMIANQVDTLIAGSNYPAISSKDVCRLIIPLPPLPEQRAIAEVLSDMDAAIAALERQRAKVQALKQGMMAELLTGRVRLVK